MESLPVGCAGYKHLREHFQVSISTGCPSLPLLCCLLSNSPSEVELLEEVARQAEGSVTAEGTCPKLQCQIQLPSLPLSVCTLVQVMWTL